MKLCPLFDSLRNDDADGDVHSGWFQGVMHCNDALPREAIEAAIDCMELYGRHYSIDPYINDHIEQLRAMLPEGE
jgi:hypothetical protein